MTAAPALRPATYADLEAVAPFRAVCFLLDALFPFDTPQKPSEEA